MVAIELFMGSKSGHGSGPGLARGNGLVVGMGEQQLGRKWMCDGGRGRWSYRKWTLGQKKKNSLK